jgi:hypothetical protein
MFTGLFLSGLVALATAQAPPPQTPSSPTARDTAPQAPDPAFSTLFTLPAQAWPGSIIAVPPDPGQAPSRPAEPQKRLTGPRSKVVCGMTLILIGPDADRDREMSKTPPKGSVIYPMRRVPPPACGKDERK